MWYDNFELVNQSDQSLFIAWVGGGWRGVGGFWGKSHGFRGTKGRLVIADRV